VFLEAFFAATYRFTWFYKEIKLKNLQHGATRQKKDTIVAQYLQVITNGLLRLL